MRFVGILAICLALTACGPGIAGPNAARQPCGVLTEAQARQALDAGAAHYTTTIHANGTASGSSGVMMGRRCSRINRVPRRCVLTGDDMVVEIRQEGQETRWRLIPRNETYTIHVRDAPEVCQILAR